MILQSVEARENLRLFIVAKDGQTGFLDLHSYVDSEAFSPLKDSKEFAKVRNGGYFVEWDCGADLSADTIQRRWEPTMTSSLPQ